MADKNAPCMIMPRIRCPEPGVVSIPVMAGLFIVLDDRSGVPGDPHPAKPKNRLSAKVTQGANHVPHGPTNRAFGLRRGNMTAGPA
jgi:hypothetical protein